MLGEQTLEFLLEEQNKKNNENNSGSGSSGGSSGANPSNIPGGTVAMKAVNWGRSHSKTESSFRSAYDWGGGRTGRDPFESSPIATDCSSFVWWCFKHAGVELNGGATGMTTWSIIADTKLETIATRGQKNSAIFDKMKAGDIIWFRNCEHIGIYCGEGKMVACNGSGNMNESPTAGIIVSDMTSGYWWDTFDGDVKDTTNLVNSEVFYCKKQN
ncbi:C40 family peptidase [Enterococcus faecium]|nr:C40 family peptidase [Enterococcus faecium]